MAAESLDATPIQPEQGKKYFTVAEANRALPYVQRIVDDITKAYRQGADLQHALQHPSPDQAEQDTDALREDIETQVDLLNSYVDELTQMGVEIKDYERGLVDFPAVFEDREICLCWHRGEDRLEAWHEPSEGFAGRQDIALLKGSDADPLDDAASDTAPTDGDTTDEPDGRAS